VKLPHFIPVILLCLITLQGATQQSDFYTVTDRIYDQAVELFEKEKYSAAQEEFRLFIEEIDEKQDEIRINAEYYFGICSLYLFHKDAEYILEKFVTDHPDSRWVEHVYLELAGYNYQRKRYKKALEWFEFVDPLSLKGDAQLAFYYKRGHSRFEQDQISEAKTDFYAVKQSESEYQKPALYYYSHIAYAENNHQTALDGFLELHQDESFAPLVPYYIAQIYYKQGRYDEVISYAQPMLDSGNVDATKRIPEIARLIGDSYFRQEDYTSALKYLSIYQDETDKKDKSKEDYYQFGYTKYRLADYEGALDSFSESSKDEDALAQSSLYHMADCYLKLEEKQYARTAFKGASDLDFNREVKEDALFNYAKLAYELSFNPFNEAILAFEKYLEDYPDSPRRDEAYSFLLNVYLKTKNYEEAYRSLDRIQNKDAQVKEAFQLVCFNRGAELFQTGKYDEAYGYFESVKTFPINKNLNAEAIYWKAEIAYRESKYTQAVALYNQFITEPGAFNSEFFEEANYGAGYALFKQKKYVSAITSFRKYTDAAKSDDARKKSDALIRLGDCYYVSKEYGKAIEYYDRAVAMNQPMKDYAIYQTALSYGLKGNPNKEIEVLSNLVNTQPDSRYYVDAKFQLAKTYLQSDQRNKAQPLYESIIRDHESSPYVSRSLLDLCLIHTKNGDNANAIATFEMIREKYPNDKTLKDALGIVRTILLQEKGPDYLTQLSEEHNILDISKSELDEEVFYAAADYYFNQNCARAITDLGTYLNKFNPALHATEAHFYMAECFFGQGETAKALEAYNFVIAQPVGDLSEESLIAAATIHYNEKNYTAALANYRELEGVALKKNNVLEAEIGQMRCYSKLGQNQYALDYANRVLNNEGTPEPIRNEALLMRGKLRKQAGNLDEAYYDFAELAKKTGVRAAEAKYNMALIAFEKEAYKPAERETFELIQNFAAYNEYKYKGFLLLADIYIALEDYFQAKTTLNTILDNVSEPWVIDEARKKMTEIEALQNPAPKNKSIDNIEINLVPDNGEQNENLFDESPEDNE